MQKKIIIFSRILVVAFFSLVYGKDNGLGSKGVCIVPVADLLGAPLPNKQKNEKVIDQLPYYCAPKNGCLRNGQLLFNEVVDILFDKSTDTHFCIKISHLFHITGENQPPHTIYWTNKKNIMLFDQLEKTGIDAHHVIPIPIDFRQSENSDHDDNSIVTLIMPWYDPITKKKYSVGTRFVKCHQQPSPLKQVAVNLIKTNPLQKSDTSIPLSCCIEQQHRLSSAQKREVMIALLRRWINESKGIIPYVWGGCSFVDAHDADHCFIEEKKEGASFYQWQNGKNKRCHRAIKTGFDCSGLIARAAHICGIAYFYKNTTTLARFLTPLTPNHRLEPGDLIWIPGHVMIVADLEKQTLIEARGYEHGYGKVHEISLHTVFAGIKNYQELTALHVAKQPLKRINRAGVVADVYQSFKLLKLMH